jgi:hypothetical protein
MNASLAKVFSISKLNLEAVWNFGGNSDAVGLILDCCVVSALFRLLESRQPHCGHSSDDCIKSIDLSVSVRGMLHPEQKYCRSGPP